MKGFFLNFLAQKNPVSAQRNWFRADKLHFSHISTSSLTQGLEAVPKKILIEFDKGKKVA